MHHTGLITHGEPFMISSSIALWRVPCFPNGCGSMQDSAARRLIPYEGLPFKSHRDGDRVWLATSCTAMPRAETTFYKRICEQNPVMCRLRAAHPSLSGRKRAIATHTFDLTTTSSVSANTKFMIKTSLHFSQREALT